jgi:hypothetical protein
MKARLIFYHTIIVLILTFISTGSFSQAKWSSVTRFGGEFFVNGGVGGGGAGAQSIAVDEQGNSYTTGAIFGESIQFDANNVFSLPNFNSEEPFIAKYSPSGTLIWVKVIPISGSSSLGSLYGAGMSIALNSSGEIYITGFFQGNSIAFGNTILIDQFPSNLEGFVAKFDNSGNAIWAVPFRQSDSNGTVYPTGIAVDAGKNCYVTGSFTDGVQIGNVLELSQGAYDIFITKLDNSGNVLWVRSAGGNDADYGKSISVDNSGHCFITGYIQSVDAVFGPVNFGPDVFLHSSPHPDFFVASYDQISGFLNWARQAVQIQDASGYFPTSGSSGTGVTCDLTPGCYPCDNEGGCFVTGYFFGEVQFQSNTLISGSKTGHDIFVARYNSDGSLAWINKEGNSVDAESNCIAYKNGRVYIGGSLEGQANFNNGAVLGPAPPPKITSYNFIASYFPSGKFDFATCSSLPSFSPYPAQGTGVYGIAGGPNIGSSFTAPRTVYVTGGTAGDMFLNNDLQENDGGLPYYTTSQHYLGFVATYSSPQPPIILFRTDNKNVDSYSLVAQRPFRVFPNPSSGSFEIQFESYENSIVQIELTDVIGKRVYFKEEPTSLGVNSITINSEDLSEGVYFIKVVSGSENHCNKIVIKK